MAVFAAQHQSVACDTLKMNQLCKVCGEPAAGFHFGAFTCEGCKSFFGRSYNNLSVISECKNGGQCVINKKNRTSCKACRLRKCLLVGMSKSGSRYGRRSNWFKLHCLMQEQGPVSVPTSSPASSNNNNNNNSTSTAGGNSSNNSSAESAAAAAFRRGFHHHHHQMMMNGLNHTQPSSMSSNESISNKDDPDAECKNSSAASPRTSVSSPGSHHSDSSLELMDRHPSPHPPMPPIKRHHHQGIHGGGLGINPFMNLKGQTFNPADFFPPLGMPGLLPPHLQAAAAAAAAAANLHHAGFYPTHSLPAPRLLFPAEMAFPSVSSANSAAAAAAATAAALSVSSRPSLLSSKPSSNAAKKFNIESMLLQHHAVQQAAAAAALPQSKPTTVAPSSNHKSLTAEEQDCPMDLSVRSISHIRGGSSDRDSSYHSRMGRGMNGDDSADEFGDDSNASDTLNDDDEDIDDHSSRPQSPVAVVERKHPLDLTRK